MIIHIRTKVTRDDSNDNLYNGGYHEVVRPGGCDLLIQISIFAGNYAHTPCPSDPDLLATIEGFCQQYIYEVSIPGDYLMQESNILKSYVIDRLQAPTTVNHWDSVYFAEIKKGSRTFIKGQIVYFIEDPAGFFTWLDSTQEASFTIIPQKLLSI